VFSFLGRPMASFFGEGSLLIDLIGGGPSLLSISRSPSNFMSFPFGTRRLFPFPFSPREEYTLPLDFLALISPSSISCCPPDSPQYPPPLRLLYCVFRLGDCSLFEGKLRFSPQLHLRAVRSLRPDTLVFSPHLFWCFLLFLYLGRDSYTFRTDPQGRFFFLYRYRRSFM